MVSPFETIAIKLGELGFYNFFLPWIITATVLWGLFKKSEMFESPSANAILSLSISFFIWGYLIGPRAIELGTPLSTFVTQGMAFLLIFLFGLVGASMFYPKFSELLLKEMKRRTVVYIVMTVFIVLFFTSRLHRVLMGEGGIADVGPERDVTLVVVMLAVLMIGMFLVFSVHRMGEE